MRKKLLAILLAMTLVLAFSSLALAADFTVTADEAEIVVSGTEYTVYSDADSVELSIERTGDNIAIAPGTHIT